VKPAVFHRHAEEELDDAMAYDESRRLGLGLSFHAEVERAVQLIERDPERWAVYKNTAYRRCSVKRFPYVLYYLRLDPCARIAAVAHQKRKPGYWPQSRPP
jgi:plasmid stabilization system protein ParE